MAKFSQQFLANLGRPQMAESLFGLGTAIGSLPGQAKAKAKQEQFNKIMDLANRAMVTNDPVNLGRARRQLQELGFTEEANKLTAAQMQAEQKRTTTGMFQDALGQPRGFTPEQKAAYIAKGATPEQVLAASELGKATGDPARDRGRARLRALAMNPQFNPTDPKQLEGYKGIARATRVNPEEAMEILSKERGTMVERAKLASTKAGSGDFGFAEGETWVDKNNNYYSQGTRRNKQTGKYETVFDPITPGAPDMPVGPLTPIMPGTLETQAERIGRELEVAEGKAELDITKTVTIEEAKDFNKQKIKAAERLTAVNQGLEKVNAMLQIVDGLNTGSTLAQMSDLVQTALGYRETDRGVFEKLALQLVADNIKTYGSNPSDGERAAVQAMLPSLENTSAINREILEMARGRFTKERAAINYIQQKGMTLEKYVKFVDSLYPSGEDGVDPATGNKVVDINNIP